MDLNGLDKTKRAYLSKHLAISERFHAEAEKTSRERKAYSAILYSMTQNFEDALLAKDYNKIFELEKVAQIHDAEFHAADKEKSLHFFSALDGLYKQFLDGQDSEKVKEKFLPSMKELKMVGARMRDKTFDITARSLCSFINSFKSPRCVPAENFYYYKRVECIKEIQKEHQRNIDHALGVEKNRDRGLSR